MKVRKIGRVAIAITAVSAIALAGLFALLCMHLYHLDGDADYIRERFMELIGHLALPAVLTLVFAIIGFTLTFAVKGDARVGKRSDRKTLEVYEKLYSINGGETGNKVKKLVGRRNAVDLAASMLLTFSLVSIVYFLLLFDGFGYEDITADALKLMYFLLPVATVSVGFFLFRIFYSEKQTAEALKLLGADRFKQKVVEYLPKDFASGNFLKFKKKVNVIRSIRAAMVGVSFGLLVGGIWLILTKLTVLPNEPISSLYVGIGVSMIIGGLTFLVTGRSDRALAEELDSEFNLKDRVGTMIAYSGESGDMLALQRQDTDRALSKISSGAYKFKGLWIYVTALVLSSAVLVGGFIVKDMRNYVPPEEVIPFELSELQEAGILELIKYVEASDMEEEFSAPIADELRELLDKLYVIDTQKDMVIALTESMAVITEITYNSSTATEMLNALWDSENIYFKHLAKTLDTSAWNSPDWVDFAEKTVGYIDTLTGKNDKSENAVVGVQRLKIALDGMTRRLDSVLKNSGLSEDDEMYLAVKNIFADDKVGLAKIFENIDSLSDKEAREALENSFNTMGEGIFSAISLNRVNAVVGEYSMTRLASLFLVPIPEFERPEFVKKNESVDGGNNSASDDDKKENGSSDGGIGEGATYGSEDLVLNPLTGKYEKYGELINKYNALMYERLEGDSYTEEQKTAIKKYFELLYSGIKKEEGN